MFRPLTLSVGPHILIGGVNLQDACLFWCGGVGIAVAGQASTLACKLHLSIFSRPR